MDVDNQIYKTCKRKRLIWDFSLRAIIL